jgi:hypothetical protein
MNMTSLRADNWRGIVTMTATMVAVIVISACGTSSHVIAVSTLAGAGTTKSSADSEFIRCLKLHGIAHPEDVPGRSREELAVPGLTGVYGMRVPVGVNRAKFAAAVKKCSNGELHVGRVAVTSPVLQSRILGLTSCLARNGYTLPPPNFPGPGPVIDTSGVNIASARWEATATGCYVDNQLNQAALAKCMSPQALEGVAERNALFQQQLLELPRCLKRNAAQ